MRPTRSDFLDLERRGFINYRASLRQFSKATVECVTNSQLLDGYDQESVLEVLAGV
jgi:hypothetical protein